MNAGTGGDSTVVIEPMSAAHADAVLGIYAEGIATGTATFESTAPSWADFDADHLREHRYVAVDGDRVLGWIAASPASGRCVYSGVIEHSVYVSAAARGRGVGRLLVDELLDSARRHGVWTVQCGVFGENGASLALHRAAGFRLVGTRERLGRMSHGPWAGHWMDVLLLERRFEDALVDSPSV